MFCTLQQVVYLTVRLLFVDFKFGGCGQTLSLRMNSVKSGFSKKTVVLDASSFRETVASVAVPVAK